MALSLTSAPCAYCFRPMSLARGGEHDPWTWCEQTLIVALARHDRPPYADIVCNHWANASLRGSLVRVCEHCNIFIRKRTGARRGAADAEEEEEGRTRVCKGRKHSMHLTIEYLLSGGIAPQPCKPHFVRSMETLGMSTEQQPQHPFLAVEWLRECIAARKRVQNSDCAVRWLLAGRPRVFHSLVWAKRVRQWRHLSAGAAEWIIASHETACRFCCLPQPSDAAAHATYQGALTFGLASGAMEARLREMELALEDDPARWCVLAEKLVFFCPRCRRLGVVAHAYHCALWPRLGMTPLVIADADAYYSSMLTRIAKKKQAAAAVLPPSLRHLLLLSSSAKSSSCAPST